MTALESGDIHICHTNITSSFSHELVVSLMIILVQNMLFTTYHFAGIKNTIDYIKIMPPNSSL